MRLLLLCVLGVALLPGSPLHAQSGDPVHPASSTVLPPILRVDARQAIDAGYAVVPFRPEGGRPAGWLVVGGAAGGGVGMIAGMLIGAVVDGPADDDCIDFCFGPGLILGTLAGEAAGVALGVHLANGRQGSLPMGVLASAGLLALGGLVALEAPELLLVIPLAQVVGAIQVERVTGR